MAEKAFYRKTYLREYVADLCGISPLLAADLFRKNGYSPHEVRAWLFKAYAAKPNRDWESGKRRAKTKQERLPEKMTEIRKQERLRARSTADNRFGASSEPSSMDEF